MDNYKLYNGDCLEIMQTIPDKSIDCILCDLPYGTTSCEWDKRLDFTELWKQYNRIIKKQWNYYSFFKRIIYSRFNSK